MLGTVPTWVSVVQLLAAGLVVGICVLQWIWWRGETRSTGAVWAMRWSADIGLMLVVGGLYPMVAPGLGRDLASFAYLLLVGGFLVVAIPATRAFGAGPRPRWWLATATAVLAVTAVAWWLPATSPLHGTYPWVTVALLLSLAGVTLAYVVAALGRAQLTPLGALLVVAGAESLAMLTAGALLPPESLGGMLVALWPIPVAVALGAMALRHLRLAQEQAQLQHTMRDATAQLANAAWFARDADALLLKAREAARAVLGDDSIEASLRPISHGRFVCELYSAAGRDQDEQARAFLTDLGHLVSVAAERYALAGKLEQTAFADPLTRLPNRRAAEQHLREILERANVERTRVSLVYCDLDGFKRINDVCGHAAGDSVLVRVAEYLRSSATGEDAYVGRLGGDEFVVVIARAPSDAALAELAQHLREGFVDRSVGTRPARLSVGVATWVPGDVVDPDALVRNADTAMLEAKRSRSGFRVYDRELRRRVEVSHHRRNALEAAVEAGGFVAHFQPVVDARTLEVVQVETLARWVDGGQLMLPAEWLDVAEESGLIVPIGLEMLRQARVALQRFQMPVAVNVSARQLSEPDALEKIEDAWGDAFWEHLSLEITESTLVSTSAAVPILSELRARGAQIAVDDFGTGYSSLARLSRLPVDVLKVDRSFVRDLESERGRSVVRTIIDLAHAHGLEVIAEGVERASDLDVLVELGVRRVQGNFLGRATAQLPVRGPRPEALPQRMRKLRSVPTQGRLRRVRDGQV